MFKYDAYYYKDENDTKLSLDWFKFEDRWTQRYMFDRPMWPENQMEKIKERNLNRHEWFTIRINLFSYKISLDIRLKKVGNVYNGRLL